MKDIQFKLFVRWPVPVRPLVWEDRVADGVELFTYQQCAEKFGKTAEYWERQW